MSNPIDLSLLPASLHELLVDFAALCRERGVAGWLVGGAVRDLALGRIPNDLDLAVERDGMALARAFADRHQVAFVALDDARGTGRVVFPLTEAHGRVIVDVAQLRAASLETDLRLRDFTINAVALPLVDLTATIDPCAGLADLASGVLRACSSQSLSDDPLRLLRTVRIAAQFNLAIAPELDADIRAHYRLIDAVATERVRDELLRLLDLLHAAPWLHYLDDVRLLTRVIPELEPARTCDQPIVHFLPVLAHSLETVTGVEWLLAADAQSQLPVAVQTHPGLPRDLPYAERYAERFAVPRGEHTYRALFKLATLLHDNAKPQTKQPKPNGGVSFYGHQDIGAEVAATVARRLRLSRQDVGYVAGIVREHMRPGQLRTAENVGLRAITRFFRDTEDAGPDVLLHEMADHLATRGPQLDPTSWQNHREWVQLMLDHYWQPAAAKPPRLIDGNDLMTELKLEPSRTIGLLLHEIDEAQASGEISSRAEAIERARQLLSQQMDQ